MSTQSKEKERIMENSKIKLKKNLKNRVIAFITTVLMFVSMLSLTTLVAADGGDYVPNDLALEYVPEIEQESEQDIDIPEEVVGGEDYVEDIDVEYADYDADEASYDDYYYYEYDYEDKYEEEYILWGDVNGDGVVDNADVELLARYIGNIYPLPAINMYAFNQDGVVSSDDLSALIRYVYNISQGISRASLGRTGGGLVGPEAIWHLSHETVLPAATYVDVRLYLHQNPTVSANPHGGIDISFIRFAYDPAVLSISSAEFAPRVEYFDFDLLDDAEQASFDAAVAAFMGFPFNHPYERANELAKEHAMFAHAWTRSNVPNHEGFNVALHLSRETVGDGGHVLGPNIVQVFFSPGDNHNPLGHPYVYIRFEVAANFNTVGDYTILTMPPPGVVQDMAGSITVLSRNGSVTIEGFDILYRANAQSGGTVSNLPASQVGLSPGTHATRTGVPTHTNVNRNGVSTVVLFVGWSQTQTNRIFALGERGDLPADWIPAGGNVTITNADVPLYAIWGWSTDGHGIPDVLRYSLDIQNVPGNLTHTGQTVTIGGETLPATPPPIPGTHGVASTTPVSLVAGGIAQNHYFLGWYRVTDRVPQSGDNINDISLFNQSNLIRAGGERPNPHTTPRNFIMPATDVHYVALWGSRDIVGAYAARITFHAYGVGDFGRDAENNPITTIVIPVIFGQNVNLGAIENYLVSEEDAFAFWGWFTHEGLRSGIPRADLDEYGRRASQSDGVLRRRPAIGSFGFEGGFGPTVTAAGFTRALSFTETQWNAIADNTSNLELHAIWSLWGDVDDNDRVNSDDLRELTWHVGQLAPRPTLNLAAADVHRNGVVNSDDLRELTWYVGQLSPRPVLGRRATPPPAPSEAITPVDNRAEEDTVVYDIPEYAYDTYEYVAEEYAYEELYTGADDAIDNTDVTEEDATVYNRTEDSYYTYEYVAEEDAYAEFSVFYASTDSIIDEVIDGTGVTESLLTNEATEVTEAAETIIEEAAAVAAATSVAGKKLPQTGVEGTMLLWASLMTLALMLALGAVAEIKKRKDGNDA